MKSPVIKRLITIAALLLPLLATCAADLFVATDGHDDNLGTKEKPFRTLDAARAAAQKLTGGKTIYVRGGCYELERTLTLGAKDSTVTWRAFEGEHPVLMGGRQINGFTVYKGGILKAPGIKGVYFRQLFFDGQRQQLARYPNFDEKNPYGGGWAYADGNPLQTYM